MRPALPSERGNAGGGQFEQVVVNDGSTDETKRLCEAFARDNKHISYHEFGANRGTNAARNAGIAAAKYEWCLFLDSDDVLLPEAITTISDYIDTHPEGRHFAFAPDDMQAYYMENAVIRGADEKILTYHDFLRGSIGGDFIHVMRTDILRRHPFDERLRIYEGVFFLSFYREAGSVMFRNVVVVHRDRGRADSVSREYIRTSVKAIENRALSSEILLQRFGGEMERLNMQSRLNEIRVGLLDCYVLLGKYNKANNIIPLVAGGKAQLLKVVCRCRMGWAYRVALRLYLTVKYKVVRLK